MSHPQALKFISQAPDPFIQTKSLNLTVRTEFFFFFFAVIPLLFFAHQVMIATHCLLERLHNAEGTIKL